MEANAEDSEYREVSPISGTPVGAFEFKKVRKRRKFIRGYDLAVSVCALPKEALAEREGKSRDLEVWYSCRYGFVLHNFTRVEDVVDFVNEQLTGGDTRVYVGLSSVCAPRSPAFKPYCEQEVDFALSTLRNNSHKGGRKVFYINQRKQYKPEY